MPASKIDTSLRQFATEPVLCWCNGQSLESRYSPSAGSAGAGAAGKLGGAGVLRYQLGKARLPGAVPMPRFPLVAVSGSHVFLFDGPSATRPPFATLARHGLRVVYGGNVMWRRLDLLAGGEAGQRAYTIVVSGLGGGRRRMEQVVTELQRTAEAT